MMITIPLKSIRFVPFFIFFTILFTNPIYSQKVQLALLKYGGGGDWYINPTSLPNLIAFCNKEINTNLEKNYAEVEPGSSDIFNYPYVHITGHGNIYFTESEVQNLRTYMLSGGFIHADDNYGLEPYIRREIKKIFPEKELVELPFTHPIYHQKYDFDEGLPKVHEHDGLPPQGFAIIHEGTIVFFFSYECDLGNGWEDESIHNDPPEIRLQALKMGANIIQYVFMSRE